MSQTALAESGAVLEGLRFPLTAVLAGEVGIRCGWWALRRLRKAGVPLAGKSRDGEVGFDGPELKRRFVEAIEQTIRPEVRLLSQRVVGAPAVDRVALGEGDVEAIEARFDRLRFAHQLPGRFGVLGCLGFLPFELEVGPGDAARVECAYEIPTGREWVAGILDGVLAYFTAKGVERVHHQGVETEVLVSTADAAEGKQVVRVVRIRSHGWCWSLTVEEACGVGW
jgi:hypothetical protein